MTKDDIARLTGIPAELLTGKTAEENIRIAESLLSFKHEQKSTAEQFSDWVQAQTAEDPQSDPIKIQNARKYPVIHDGGELTNIPEQPVSTRDQFADWAWKIGLFNF